MRQSFSGSDDSDEHHSRAHLARGGRGRVHLEMETETRMDDSSSRGSRRVNQVKTFFNLVIKVDDKECGLDDFLDAKASDHNMNEA